MASMAEQYIQAGGKLPGSEELPITAGGLGSGLGKALQQELEKERERAALRAAQEQAAPAKTTSSYKKGGSVKSSASKRADGCCVRGKTRA